MKRKNTSTIEYVSMHHKFILSILSYGFGLCVCEIFYHCKQIGKIHV